MKTIESLYPKRIFSKTKVKTMNRKQAYASARQKSKSQENIRNRNRVYAFRWAMSSNQYYSQGKYYTQVFSPSKSFNLGGKDNVVCYIAGTQAKEKGE